MGRGELKMETHTAYTAVICLISAGSVALPVLVIYVVVTQSLGCMKTYRKFLINFTLFDALFSLTLGVLCRPLPLFPFTGAEMTGFFRYLPHCPVVSMAALINTCGYAISTQCACLIFRFSVVYGNRDLHHFVLSNTTWLVCYMCSLAVTVFTVFLIGRMQVPDELIISRMSQIKDIFPFLTVPYTEVHLQKVCLVYYDIRGGSVMLAGALIIFGFVCAEVISIGSVWMILRHLEGKKESFTRATYRMHRHLTVALGFQLLTPIAFFIVPVLISFLFAFFVVPVNAAVGQWMIAYMDLYGMANSAITLYFVKPYRAFIADKLRSAANVVGGGKLRVAPMSALVVKERATVSQQVSDPATGTGASGWYNGAEQ